jgi:protein disulfide-isomerase A6
VIADLDCDNHKELGNQFGIKGFPTIKFFAKNSKDPQDYVGGRQVDDFVSFLEIKTGIRV